MVLCVVLFCVIWLLTSDGLALYFFFQAEDGIRDLVRSRGLGDVYKRQLHPLGDPAPVLRRGGLGEQAHRCLEPVAHRDGVQLSLIHI